MVPPTAEFREGVLYLKGDWRLPHEAPKKMDLPETFAVDLGEVAEWDSTLPAYLWSLKRRYGRSFKLQHIPEPVKNIEKLLAVASVASTKAEAVKPAPRLSLFEKAIAWLEGIGEATASATSFLGEIFIAWGALIAHKTHFRSNDWLKEFHEVGWKALPIVALISFLVGMIVAFVSAVQLELFGATIYVADLVGLSMMREMGALMTGIIMAGRTGAAYAAQIGSMKRTEELDAMRTMGLNPIEMVVLPRVIALTTTMPLLSIFAVFLGIFAGMIICNSFFGVSVVQYMDELSRSVKPKQLFIGIAKSIIYGFLVAFAGAWRGMRCGNSADAVGRAATSAVVMGITLIVFANAIFAVLLNAFNI